MTRKLVLLLTVAAALLGGTTVIATAGAARSAGRRAAAGHALSPAPTPAPAVTATNALGLKLLPRLGAGGNVVFSPYSIQTALAMLDQGAAGTTAAQIDRLLGGQSAPALAAANDALSARLSAAVQAPHGAPAADAVKLLTADALWVQSGLALQQPFRSALLKDFGAAPQAASFSTAPDAARQAINSWAATHTAQLIKHLMPAGSITSQTALVLANAIYLKARWENPFVKASTANAPFFTSQAQHVSVPFMTERAFEAPYGAGPGYRAIDLPYADSTLSLLAVMPAQGTLPAFQRKLTPASLARIAAALRTRNVDLQMPRLTLRLQASLNGVLEALGMPVAFSGLADFSGITHKESLKIQQVEHGAFMRVDEAGTVAAAATGISTEPTAVLGGPMVHLSLNHPFLLFLRDDATGAILFAGRVVNPGGS